MKLRDEDLEIAAGCLAVHPDRMGGQHVAKLCTGVRITYLPTGVSVLCTDRRSQYANRMRALELLTQILCPHTKTHRGAYLEVICDDCGALR